MKLADLRKVAVRQQFEIRFPLSNGMECVIDRHGIAHVPGLHAIPGFNLETELESATQFLMESPADAKGAVAAKRISREDLTAMADASPAAAVHEHEEE